MNVARYVPVGALRANWSNVRISPPAFNTRTRALSVNRSAQMVNLGTSRSLQDRRRFTHFLWGWKAMKPQELSLNELCRWRSPHLSSTELWYSRSDCYQIYFLFNHHPLVTDKIPPQSLSGTVVPLVKVKNNFLESSRHKSGIQAEHSPDIISDCTNDNANLLSLRSFHSTNNSRQRDWWFVDLAHKQPLQHNLIELRISPPCEESVQLDKNTEVRVLRHGRFSVLLFVFVVFYVNTHVVGGMVFL